MPFIADLNGLPQVLPLREQAIVGRAAWALPARRIDDVLGGSSARLWLSGSGVLVNWVAVPTGDDVVGGVVSAN